MPESSMGTVREYRGTRESLKPPGTVTPNRPFQNCAGNWGDFQILTTR